MFRFSLGRKTMRTTKDIFRGNGAARLVKERKERTALLPFLREPRPHLPDLHPAQEPRLEMFRWKGKQDLPVWMHDVHAAGAASLLLHPAPEILVLRAHHVPLPSPCRAAIQASPRLSLMSSSARLTPAGTYLRTRRCARLMPFSTTDFFNCFLLRSSRHFHDSGYLSRMCGESSSRGDET